VATALERSRRLVLPEVIGRGRRAHLDRAALVFGDAERTHAALHERAERLATVLAQAGVRRGDRVALLLHNGLEFPESLLACHAVGAVAVPVNFRLAPDEISYILRDAGAVALIAGEGSPSPAVDGLVLTTGRVYEDAIASADPHTETAALREDDPALMCYTSGTTGRPKGAVLTHGNLVASTLSWIHEMRAGQGDVWLSGQPLFHIGGINGLLPFLTLGATSIVTPTTGFDPEAALERIERHGVTMCIFVPTQWDLLCRSERVARLDRSRRRAGGVYTTQSPRHA
jgi:fatty-acyl-CoA synthase